MKLELVNPFLESTQSVIEQIANISSSQEELVVSKKTNAETLWVKIGIKGQLHGNLMLEMENKVALVIVSKMMGGFELTQIDEMGKSAISELGNMISGNASMLLSQEGIDLDITPPEILCEYRHENTSNATIIPLQLEEVGQMKIMVHLTEMVR